MQSGQRKVDLCFVRTIYNSDGFLENDFMGPVGSYEIHVTYGAPKEINYYLKLVRPFSNQIWACFFVSLVTIYLSLILTNKIYAAWTNSTMNETPYQSKRDDYRYHSPIIM